jgi:hypothetical protein
LDSSLIDIDTVLEAEVKAHRQLLIITNDSTDTLEKTIKDLHLSSKVKILSNVSDNEV